MESDCEENEMPRDFEIPEEAQQPAEAEADDNSSETDEMSVPDLDRLVEIYPGEATAVLRQALDDCGGDFDAACAKISEQKQERVSGQKRKAQEQGSGPTSSKIKLVSLVAKGQVEDAPQQPTASSRSRQPKSGRGGFITDLATLANRYSKYSITLEDLREILLEADNDLKAADAAIRKRLRLEGRLPEEIPPPTDVIPRDPPGPRAAKTVSFQPAQCRLNILSPYPPPPQPMPLFLNRPAPPLHDPPPFDFDLWTRPAIYSQMIIPPKRPPKLLLPVPGPPIPPIVVEDQDVQEPGNSAQTELMVAEEEVKSTTEIPGEFVTEGERETCELVLKIFPEVDPRYVIERIVQHGEELHTIVNRMSDNSSYPKLKQREAAERQQQRRQQFLDPAQFEMDEFLRNFPDPVNTFDPEGERDRENPRTVTNLHREHATVWLMNRFPNMRRDFLERQLQDNNNRLPRTLRWILEGMGGTDAEGRRRKARNYQMPQYLPDERQEPVPWPAEVEEQFFRELQFIENETQIRELLGQRAAERERRTEELGAAGGMLECQCCCGECLPEDMIQCTNTHSFCHKCVTQHADTIIGQGGEAVGCLMPGCDREYSLAQLQALVRPCIFNIFLRLKQQQELRDAGLQNMESCPFCDFAMVIDNSQEKIFTCLNPNCRRESCRQCRQPNHIPRRCAEVEQDADVRMRTCVENAMADALIRTCPQCNKRLIKSDGCNKLKCPCGAAICYVCRQLLTSRDPYGHFGHSIMGFVGARRNRMAGERGVCPMNTTVEEVHADVAERAGNEARERFLKENPKLELKKEVKEEQVKEMVDRGNQYGDQPGLRRIMIMQHRARARFEQMHMQLEQRNRQRAAGLFGIATEQDDGDGRGGPMDRMLRAAAGARDPPQAQTRQAAGTRRTVFFRGDWDMPWTAARTPLRTTQPPATVPAPNRAEQTDLHRLYFRAGAVFGKLMHKSIKGPVDHTGLQRRIDVIREQHRDTTTMVQGLGGPQALTEPTARPELQQRLEKLIRDCERMEKVLAVSSPTKAQESTSSETETSTAETGISRQDQMQKMAERQSSFNELLRERMMRGQLTEARQRQVSEQMRRNFVRLSQLRRASTAEEKSVIEASLREGVQTQWSDQVMDALGRVEHNAHQQQLDGLDQQIDELNNTVGALQDQLSSFNRDPELVRAVTREITNTLRERDRLVTERDEMRQRLLERDVQEEKSTVKVGKKFSRAMVRKQRIENLRVKMAAVLQSQAAVKARDKESKNTASGKWLAVYKEQERVLTEEQHHLENLLNEPEDSTDEPMDPMLSDDQTEMEASAVVTEQEESVVVDMDVEPVEAPQPQPTDERPREEKLQELNEHKAKITELNDSVTSVQQQMTKSKDTNVQKELLTRIRTLLQERDATIQARDKLEDILLREGATEAELGRDDERFRLNRDEIEGAAQEARKMTATKTAQAQREQAAATAASDPLRAMERLRYMSDGSRAVEERMKMMMMADKLHKKGYVGATPPPRTTLMARRRATIPNPNRPPMDVIYLGNNPKPSSKKAADGEKQQTDGVKSMQERLDRRREIVRYQELELQALQRQHWMEAQERREQIRRVGDQIRDLRAREHELRMEAARSEERWGQQMIERRQRIEVMRMDARETEAQLQRANAAPEQKATETKKVKRVSFVDWSSDSSDDDLNALPSPTLFHAVDVTTQPRRRHQLTEDQILAAVREILPDTTRDQMHEVLTFAYAERELADAVQMVIDRILTKQTTPATPPVQQAPAPAQQQSTSPKETEKKIIDKILEGVQSHLPTATKAEVVCCLTALRTGSAGSLNKKSSSEVIDMVVKDLFQKGKDSTSKPVCSVTPKQRPNDNQAAKPPEQSSEPSTSSATAEAAPSSSGTVVDKRNETVGSRLQRQNSEPPQIHISIHVGSQNADNRQEGAQSDSGLPSSPMEH